MFQLRHQGSPQSVRNLTQNEIETGLRDGVWEPTDEVLGPGETTWIGLENHPQFAELCEELEAPPHRKHVEDVHLDMNPLIDVCLVLLIFYILTTSYAQAVSKLVPLPTVNTEVKGPPKITPQQVKKMIRIYASQDGAGKPILRIENQPVQVLADDGKSIDPAKMRDAIKPFVHVSGGDRKTEVLLDAREVSWGAVVAIQDAAKAAGVLTINHVMRK